MTRPEYGIHSGPCRCCAFFCRRGDERSRRRPFCAFTGERLSKDHVEPDCTGFHFRQYSAHEGGTWATISSARHAVVRGPNLTGFG